MPIVESYSRAEEVAHSFTAAIGVLAMLLGTPWLVLRATQNGGAWRVIGVLAFGIGALMMFSTSTLYHAASRPAAKAWLRRLDHSAIYLLIAGTYTPLTIGVIGGTLGWALFGIVWGIAIAGVTVKLGESTAHTARFDSALPCDRLDWRRGVQAVVAQLDLNAVQLDGGRGFVLHGRRALLLMEA